LAKSFVGGEASQQPSPWLLRKSLAAEEGLSKTTEEGLGSLARLLRKDLAGLSKDRSQVFAWQNIVSFIGLFYKRDL